MTRRLLVIDDEDDIREILALTLEHLGGFQVVAVASGPEGVAAAREQHFDAVLLDWMMPVLDGEATARLLRDDERTRDLPIILLTAAPELPTWADELAIRGHLAKPFDPAELPKAVSGLLA